MGYQAFFLEHSRFLGFGLLLTLSSSCGQTFFVALSGGYVRSELDLSDGGWGFLYSAATLTSASLLPWVGRLIDHVDLRIYSALVCLGLGVGCFTMGLVAGPPGLFFAFLLLRLFGQGLLGHTAGTSMARYFDVDRGKAMSLVALGHPLGEATLPIVIVGSMDAIGWRSSWGITGGVLLGVVLPAVLWLLRGHGERHRRHQAKGSLASRGEAAAPAMAWDRRRVVKDLRFYLVLPAVMAPPFIGTGVFFHQVRLCELKGWSTPLFASAFIVYAVATVCASLSVGPLVDRFGARRLFGGVLLPHAAALLCLAVFDAPATVFVYMLGAGITAGASSPIVGSLWAEMYGVRHLGAIRSLVFGVMVFATACSPGPLGWLLDQGVAVGALAASACGYTLVSSIAATAASRGSPPGAEVATRSRVSARKL